MAVTANETTATTMIGASQVNTAAHCMGGAPD